LRRPDIDVDLAFEDVDLVVEMELARSLEDDLSGFLIDRDTKRGILGKEFRKRRGELFPVGLSFWLDCDFDQPRLRVVIFRHRSNDLRGCGRREHRKAHFSPPAAR
jgi:hypothetical protein